MKIFIWEGNGISDAYHDDGTLVVLANTPEEAREVVLEEKREKERQDREREKELTEAANNAGITGTGDAAYRWRREDEKAMVAAMTEIDKKYPLVHNYEIWDGTEEALNREPDKVIELDKPCLVAFNGGGYD